MYIPRHFSITDFNEVCEFVEAQAFGQLISSVEGELFASHLPLEVSADRTRIVCHLARQNSQLGGLQGQDILLIVPGPHGYISPTWFAAAGVPTWNYQAVHIRGRCQLFDDAGQLRASIEGLAARHEAAFDSPWQPDYDPAMLRGIVGVEITITDIQCKYKLSQNRSAQDRAQVIEQLRARGNEALAQAMERAQD